MRRTLLVLSLLSAAACTQPPGELVTFETICTPKYNAREEKGLEVGQRLAIVGRLSLGRSMFKVCGRGTCDALLLPEPGSTAKALRIDLPLGSSKSTMEPLPKKYSVSDFKVKTAEGTMVGEGGLVKVTGIRHGGSHFAPNGCWLTVDKIEAQ